MPTTMEAACPNGHGIVELDAPRCVLLYPMPGIPAPWIQQGTCGCTFSCGVWLSQATVPVAAGRDARRWRVQLPPRQPRLQ